MQNKLLVPDIGDFEKVEIIEILVEPGKKIKKNDPIVTLESDKSSVEVPSISEGVVENVNVKIGDKVSKGDLLITLKNNLKSDEIPQKKIEEKIPPSTEEIIKEAEKSITPAVKAVKKETKTLNVIHPLPILAYVLNLDFKKIGLSRNDFMRILMKKGIILSLIHI